MRIQGVYGIATERSELIKIYSLGSEKGFIRGLLESIEIDDIKTKLIAIDFEVFDEDDFIKEFLLSFALMEDTVLRNNPIDTVLDQTHWNRL